MTQKEEIVRKIEKYWHFQGHFNEDQRDFFIHFLLEKKPKYILEIGFATGRSCVTSLLSTNPVKMISIDIDFNYMDAKISNEKINNSFENLKLVSGDSCKIIDKYFMESEFPFGVDFIFVDGGHAYNQALSDMNNTWDHLNLGGIMIVDDFESSAPNGCSIPDVDRAVYFFSEQRGLNFKRWNIKGKGFAIFVR